MNQTLRGGVWLAALALGLVVACSDTTDDRDKETGPSGDSQPLPDLRRFPDGFRIYTCKWPGQACNPHNPCAINPVCTKQNECIPEGFMDCNDALSCTTDQCAGLGICKNTPKAGTCALPVVVSSTSGDAGATPDAAAAADAGSASADAAGRGPGGSGDASTADASVGDASASDAGPDDAGTSPADAGYTYTERRCFKHGDRNPNEPCLICHNPTDDSSTEPASPTRWTPATGGACDDGNACTKNDYCQNGYCAGTNYASQCADQYGCTDDPCDGKGGCLPNKLKKDWCLINGVCYKDKDKHPSGSCLMCDVSKSQATWSSIGDSCMINGKCYSKGDKDSTGCNACDPAKSTTAWTPLTGLCSIDGACYKNGAKHPNGCAVCDTSVSNTKWTVKGSYCYINKTCLNPGAKDTTGCGECDPTKDKYNWSTVKNTCLISGKCYAAQSKDSTGCGECDPTKNATGWTVSGNVCLISGVCYQPKQTDSSGCQECDPTKSKTTWTSVGGKCLIEQKCVADKSTDTTGCLTCDYAGNPKSWSGAGTSTVVSHDFEKGTATSWTLSNSSSSVGWAVSSHRYSGGAYALYYGNPSTKTYDTGSQNYGTATMPSVTLTASKKAGLRFMLYPDVESISTYDKLSIYVNSSLVWSKNSPSTNVVMKTWQAVTIDLSSYAGSSVSIKFEFDTQDSYSNSTEGILIDDIVLYHGC